jgi:hypothetical protein
MRVILLLALLIAASPNNRAGATVIFDPTNNPHASNPCLVVIEADRPSCRATFLRYDVGCCAAGGVPSSIDRVSQIEWFNTSQGRLDGAGISASEYNISANPPLSATDLLNLFLAGHSAPVNPALGSPPPSPPNPQEAIDALGRLAARECQGLPGGVNTGNTHCMALINAACSNPTADNAADCKASVSRRGGPDADVLNFGAPQILKSSSGDLSYFVNAGLGDNFLFRVDGD